MGGGDAIPKQKREWPAHRPWSDLSSHAGLLLSLFHSHCNRPDETQQFAADSCYNLTICGLFFPRAASFW